MSEKQYSKEQQEYRNKLIKASIHKIQKHNKLY